MTKIKLTKKELAIIISKATGFSKLFSEQVINDLIKVIIIEIKNNDCILKNFGSFKILLKNERIGRNPRTMEKFLISKRKSISFLPSKYMLRILNE